MGQVKTDASHSQHAAGDAPPPPPASQVHEFPPPPPASQVHEFPPPPPTSQVHDFPPPPPASQVHDQFPPPPPASQVHQFPPPPPPASHVHEFPPPQPLHSGHVQPQPTPQPPNINVASLLHNNILQTPLQNNQPWKTNLFGCMDDPQNAIITLFCPCVTFGQIAEVLDNGSTSCATSGTWYTCIAFCIGMPCLMSCGYRSKLRARFGLVESPAPDCLIHCFCDVCALCQEYRELQQRGLDPFIGHAGNVARQRLQQIGMIPPLQQAMMM